MASSPHATTSEKMSRGTCRSDRVRSLVLEAGAKLFSQHGFAGTSFRNLSAESGISAGLIQYHFGSKEKLYEAVREHVFSEYLRAQRPQFDLPQEEFDPFIMGGLTGYFRFLDSHPAWMRLMEWGILEGSGAPWPGEEDLMDALAERVRTVQATGRVPEDIDPDLFLILIGGLMRGWILYRTRYASRLAHIGDADAREKAYLDLCFRLLSCAAPPPTETAHAESPESTDESCPSKNERSHS